MGLIQRSTRCRARRAAAWLLGGVLVNIAVAWASLLAAPSPAADLDVVVCSRSEELGQFTRGPVGWNGRWHTPVPAHWPAPTYHYDVRWPHFSATATLDYYPNCKMGFGHAVADCAVGFPFRAATWRMIQQDPLPTAPPPAPLAAPIMPKGFLPHESAYAGGLPFPLDTAPARATPWVRVPIRPIPLGFAANSLLYAFLFWGLVAAPLKLRAALRSRRGACPACNYPLTGLRAATACPECGTPLDTPPSHPVIPSPDAPNAA